MTKTMSYQSQVPTIYLLNVLVTFVMSRSRPYVKGITETSYNGRFTSVEETSGSVSRTRSVGFPVTETNRSLRVLQYVGEKYFRRLSTSENTHEKYKLISP